MSPPPLVTSTWHQNFRPFVNDEEVDWETLHLDLLAGETCRLTLYYKYSWMVGHPDGFICLEYRPGAEGEGVVFDPPLGQLLELAEGTTSLSWNITTEMADIGSFILQFTIPPMSDLPKSPIVPLQVIDVPLEVVVMFDTIPVGFDALGAYPCIGAKHVIRVRRKPSDYLRDREVMLLWDGSPAENLGVAITPSLEHSKRLTLDWTAWEMDCTAGVKGSFSLRLNVVETGQVTDALPLFLGHNLVSSRVWRSGPHGTPGGHTFYIVNIMATSKFTEQPASGVQVRVNGVPKLVTGSDGVATTSQMSEPLSLSILNPYDGSLG